MPRHLYINQRLEKLGEPPIVPMRALLDVRLTAVLPLEHRTASLQTSTLHFNISSIPFSCTPLPRWQMSCTSWSDEKSLCKVRRR